MIDKARTSLGERLARFRESLDPSPTANEHVPAYAMERAGKIGRGRWRIAEQERNPTEQAVDYALGAVSRALGCLSITQEQRQAAMAFARGEAAADLPWTSPPPWLPGRNPNKRTGRPKDDARMSLEPVKTEQRLEAALNALELVHAQKAEPRAALLLVASTIFPEMSSQTVINWANLRRLADMSPSSHAA